MMRKSVALLVLMSACLLAVPAKATIVITDLGSAFPPPPPLGSFMETFDPSPTLPGQPATFTDSVLNFTATGVTPSKDPKIVHGSSSCCAAPRGDTTNYLSVLGGGTETIKFNTGFVGNNFFGLYIGSLDGYNKIAFYDGNTLIDSFSGGQIAAATGMLPNGGVTSTKSNGFVTFTGLGAFTSVVLTSANNSFEVDDVTVKFSVSSTPPVPEASTWVMMILGFLGVGMVGYRRRGLAFRPV
jgi:hypothetical protein